MTPTVVIINPKLPLAAQVPSGWTLMVDRHFRPVALPTKSMPGFSRLAVAWSQPKEAA